MSKKLKILTASDLHGNMDIAKKLSEKAKKNKVDLVILAGDITGGEEDDGRILSPFLKAKQKVVFVPGNWDSRKEHLAMRKKAKSVDKYYVTYGDVGIGGIGNEDWNFNFNEEDLKEMCSLLFSNSGKLQNAIKNISIKDLSNKCEFPNYLGYLGLGLHYSNPSEKENKILTTTWIPQLISLMHDGENKKRINKTTKINK